MSLRWWGRMSRRSDLGKAVTGHVRQCLVVRDTRELWLTNLDGQGGLANSAVAQHHQLVERHFTSHVGSVSRKLRDRESLV